MCGPLNVKFVICQLRTSEVSVLSQPSICDLVTENRQWDKLFSSTALWFPAVIITRLLLHIHSFFHRRCYIISATDSVFRYHNLNLVRPVFIIRTSYFVLRTYFVLNLRRQNKHSSLYNILYTVNTEHT